MRLAFVPRRFCPESPRGLDQHTVSLVKSLQHLGLQVEVFAPRELPGLGPLAQRREMLGGTGVTWLNGSDQASDQEWAHALGSFLDRECPDLVHLEYQRGDGLAVMEMLAERGIAAIVNLHDFAPLGRDGRALAADLQPYEPDDQEARARGRLVSMLLEQHPALGSHGGWLLPDLVDRPFWEHLLNLLHGPEAPGLDAAREEVLTFRERSARAFAGWTARFASSRWLATFSEQTLASTVDCVKPGVDLVAFQGLVPPRLGRGPVRFGFLGEMDKASGVHLLLEAFDGLDGRAELRLFGDGMDRLYLRTLRARAQEVGARWYGPLDASTRAQALDRIDVLVVPSLWAESAPHEVLEALAARRPVIVCDHAATAEAIQHEHNGLHFAAGDVGALRAALLRFLDQPELLAKLELGITTPRAIAEEAREWADVYALSVASGPRRFAAVETPPHLAELAVRYRQLQGLPTRDLFEKVVRGLIGLAQRMGVELEPAQALTRAVAAGGQSRDLRLAYERIHQWLEGHAEELKLGRERLVEQESLLRRERQEVLDRERSLHMEWKGQTQQVEALQRSLELAEAERDDAAERLRLLERRTEDRLRESEREHSDAHARDRELRVHLGGLARRLLTSAEVPVQEGQPLAPGDVETVLDTMYAVIKRNHEEMTWRRGEMAKAKSAASGFLARLVGGEASAVMREWDEIPTPTRRPEFHSGERQPAALPPGVPTLSPDPMFAGDPKVESSTTHAQSDRSDSEVKVSS